MLATATSYWPTPTVSTRITSNPAASTNTMASGVALAPPAKGPQGGRGPVLGVGVHRDPRHPRLVAKDRPAGAGGRRIDGQHGDPVPLFDQVHPERLDRGRLADARNSGDADVHGAAGFWHQLQQ